MKNDTNVSDIIQAIKDKNIAVFCGAGISLDSGLPIVSTLLEYLFLKLSLSDNQKNSILNSSIPFESIMETVLIESSLEEIQDIYNLGIPNTNHLFLAKLVKLGYLKIIYTTNFDTLIEQALTKEGLVENVDFKVYSTILHQSSIDWSLAITHVIKIHGCVSNKKEMAITISQIASNKHSKLRESLLSQIFCRKSCTQILIIGYSCSDLDLVPLIEGIGEIKSNIFFIDHENTTNEIKLEHISFKSVKNPFKSYTGSRFYINTNYFIEQAWKALIIEDYQSVQYAKVDWKQNIDNWYSNAVAESGKGLKHHISSRLLYKIGEFKEVISHHLLSIEVAKKDKNLYAYSAELANLGMAYNSLHMYDDAILCFKKAIPITRALGERENLSIQLQAFANVLHHIGKDDSAVEYFNEALEIAEKDNNLYTISNILGNISNSYNTLGMYLMAITYLKRAIAIAKEIGNKQAESSQLGILAETYKLCGKLELAKSLFKEAIEMKRCIGDKYGENLLLAKLATLERIYDSN